MTRTGFFRRALRALASRHLQVEIRFVYATRGRVDDVNTKVEIKALDLRRQFDEVVSGATGVVDFLGAAELWQRATAHPSYTMQLTYQENATSGNSHVALVRLRDYLNFLADEHGELRRHIFDWNVRDYQGDVEVNKEIRGSLEDQEGPEFWWLNNGVTVICSRASVVGKTFALDDVQVVNGLQTSHTVSRSRYSCHKPADFSAGRLAPCYRRDPARHRGILPIPRLVLRPTEELLPQQREER